MRVVRLRVTTEALVCSLGVSFMCIKSPSVYIRPGSMQASELGPSVQQVLQEGPHILVHFHRIGLGDPVPHAWQDVGFEPAWHKTAADGLYQPLLKIGVLLPP